MNSSAAMAMPRPCYDNVCYRGSESESSESKVRFSE